MFVEQIISVNFTLFFRPPARSTEILTCNNENANRSNRSAYLKLSRAGMDPIQYPLAMIFLLHILMKKQMHYRKPVPPSSTVFSHTTVIKLTHFRM